MRLRLGTLGVVIAAVATGVVLTGCLPVSPPGGTTGTTTTTIAANVTTTTTLPSGAPIEPNQHYVGLVNGKSADAVIDVVCPGPIGPRRTGPPVSNQTVAVHQVASGGGDTGPAGHDLWAQFDKDELHVVAFRTYDTPGMIPTTLQLPCGGTGAVDFTTCFGTLPCALGAVDGIVTVTFENIAA
jgi:hypothetical protein